MVRNLAGYGKEFGFYAGFTGMPTEDFKQQKDRVYVLKRFSWQLCGKWIQGDKSGNGETSQETVVIIQENWIVLHWDQSYSNGNGRKGMVPDYFRGTGDKTY